MHCLLYARPCSGCVMCIQSFDSYNSTREQGYNIINILNYPHFTGKEIGAQRWAGLSDISASQPSFKPLCYLASPRLFSPGAQHPRLVGFMQHDLCISTKAYYAHFFPNQTLSSIRPDLRSGTWSQFPQLPAGVSSLLK